MPFIRPRAVLLASLLLTLTLLYLLAIPRPRVIPSEAPPAVPGWRTPADQGYFWKTLTTHYPPASLRPLPTSKPLKMPLVQRRFGPEDSEPRARREHRRHAVKATFAKCWASYRRHAWMSDELSPVSGRKRDPFGGWAATLVDALDTLWIMDMRTEFDEAVQAATAIDFTSTSLTSVNVFETTIRYLGGFIAAYDLSGDVRLLRKAVEVGEMLYKAFDTPNRMPVTRWDLHAAKRGERQVAGERVLLAEIGSLSMEFTRLSILTGDDKWFDAVQRVTELLAAQQDSTALPGLWPLVVNAKDAVFNVGSSFTLGAMADSAYEYLPKMTALTGGTLPIYQAMYEKAVTTAVKHNIFRPMTPSKTNILVSGTVEVNDGKPTLVPEGQHLACFLGGLLALAGKLFLRAHDSSVAAKLVDGCTWAHAALPHGIMPETFTLVPCPQPCEWSDALWRRHALRLAAHAATEPHTTADQVIARDRLPQGFTSIPDRRYILRPEAIESVFVLYRTTGWSDLLESAWDMFTAINASTSTRLANSAVWDVTLPKDHKPQPADEMESFWMGETLKYFYLMFSPPTLVSLDHWVFNTEAHPFKRLR